MRSMQTSRLSPRQRPALESTLATIAREGLTTRNVHALRDSIGALRAIGDDEADRAISNAQSAARTIHSNPAAAREAAAASLGSLSLLFQRLADSAAAATRV